MLTVCDFCPVFTFTFRPQIEIIFSTRMIHVKGNTRDLRPNSAPLWFTLPCRTWLHSSSTARSFFTKELACSAQTCARNAQVSISHRIVGYLYITIRKAELCRGGTIFPITSWESWGIGNGPASDSSSLKGRSRRVLCAKQVCLLSASSFSYLPVFCMLRPTHRPLKRCQAPFRLSS